MTQPSLHPWLSTPEALQAAERAVRIPAYKMAGPAQVVGADELFSEALAILTECALPPRERGNALCAQCAKPLDEVRAGAKFCSPQCRKRQAAQVMRGKTAPLPAVVKGHVGSMWTWPENQMQAYAVREVGLRLCHYLVTRAGRSEVSSSHWLESANIAAANAREPDAREVLEDYLTLRGVGFDGSETLGELTEAVTHAQGFRGTTEPVAA